MDFAGQAVRLPGVLLGHLTLLVWYYLLRPYLNEAQLRLWLGFVLLSPFLGIGSLILTPDLPLVFFWSLSLLLLQLVLARSHAVYYAFFGLALGLGFCSKYHMVLFVPIALIWLVASGDWRRINWRYLPLTVFMGLVGCSPVLWWNFRHDWASFRFQIEHGLKGGPWRWQWPLQYLVGQILLIFPTVAWLACLRREPKETRWMHAFSWLPLLFFFYTSFKARVEANWPIVAHPAILALIFLNRPSSRWIKVTMGIWGTAILIVLSQTVSPWLPVDPRRLKTTEFHKFDALLTDVQSLQPVYASSYQMAASLSYKLRRSIPKLGGMNRRDFYDFQPMSFPQTEVFYVATEAGLPLPQWLSERGYSSHLHKQVTPELSLLEVRKNAQGTDHK